MVFPGRVDDFPILPKKKKILLTSTHSAIMNYEGQKVSFQRTDLMDSPLASPTTRAADLGPSRDLTPGSMRYHLGRVRPPTQLTVIVRRQLAKPRWQGIQQDNRVNPLRVSVSLRQRSQKAGHGQLNEASAYTASIF